MWSMVEGGNTLGTAGSEGGKILIDEEHELGARITLEEGGSVAPFAITCGIYGSMVHTRFFGSREAGEKEVAAMKDALHLILTSFPDADDPERERKMEGVYDAVSRFVEEFPS
ncbi:MAG TPA: hypothetical protein VFQ61_06865 [Polyangiaceae bacterium]|nr:hypothetical protein [Polyangiaceae bacterium]